ncbi:MAG: hypothetical protein J3Q66DRAFT_357246 [Benniella sp.]|nr:MAG: hypothetical protein J3Q66DRAFT_357246 [Benniella sp.]
MTLISSPTPLTAVYPYPCSSEQHSYSLPAQQGLSWRQPVVLSLPVPVPTSTTTIASQKYRTLASIRSQLRHHPLPTFKSDPSVSPVSPSIKPGPLDSLSIENSSVSTTTALIHHHHHHHHHHASSTTPPKSASSITQAIQEMDASYGTCFLTWIHNPSNLDYISLRLRPLCLEYPLVHVANVLRWIGADWSSADCKALFRAVTQQWDQGKRRMLAFLLIRDEEMRQKAKSKLVEFAQKSKAKNIQQMRRIQQQQQQQQQQQVSPQPQHEEICRGGEERREDEAAAAAAAAGAEGERGLPWHPYGRYDPSSRSTNPLHQLQSSSSSVPDSVRSVWPTTTTTTTTTPTTLEDIAAAALITGEIPWDPIACALNNAASVNKGSIRQHRFSPY